MTYQPTCWWSSMKHEIVRARKNPKSPKLTKYYKTQVFTRSPNLRHDHGVSRNRGETGRAQAHLFLLIVKSSTTTAYAIDIHLATAKLHPFSAADIGSEERLAVVGDNPGRSNRLSKEKYLVTGDNKAGDWPSTLEYLLSRKGPWYWLHLGNGYKIELMLNRKVHVNLVGDDDAQHGISVEMGIRIISQLENGYGAILQRSIPSRHRYRLCSLEFRFWWRDRDVQLLELYS
ncbi:hypothetical protein C8J56DRAFT_893798 [Mycena floridula]|nr:hypothetical protein C8J56DRAFT_893798 [Mycena floridula]